MEKKDALEALAALGQETRLDVFRLLVRAGEAGMSAGTIAEALTVRPNTLSTHLGVLARSGLVKAERDGRTIVYRADLTTMQEMLLFLLQDCCNGSPEACLSLFSEMFPSLASGHGGSSSKQ